MRIIIARHGETAENIKGIYMGHMPGHLSKKGVQQARLLAERLKNIDIKRIYSSDLKRSMDTAQEILRFHPTLKLKLDKKLRERFYGNIQEKKWIRNVDLGDVSLGVEGNEELLFRAKSFLKNILSEKHHGIILIICHSGIKKALITALHNFSVEKFNNWGSINNTAVSEFEIKNNEIYKIISINCIKHLR